VSFSSSSCSSCSLFRHSFLFLIPNCVLFWRLVLRAHPRKLTLPHFLLGQNISLYTHTPLCKTRLVYLYSSSLHSILLSHDIISVLVFLWLRLVSLCLWLSSVEVCNPTFPLNLSVQVFFSLLVEPSVVFILFFLVL
jgi:hypothetical protein